MMRYTKVVSCSGYISLLEAFYDNEDGELLSFGDEIVGGYSEDEIVSKLENIIKDVKRFEAIHKKDVKFKGRSFDYSRR